MKLFYFLDFIHLKKYGTPITFDSYFHLENGPIPSEILNLINSVVDNEENALLADTISVERPTGTIMQRIRCAKEIDKSEMNMFSQSEIDVLNIVCRRYGEKTTTEIINASHEESPWKKTKLAQKIPYHLASYDKDCLFDEEEIKLVTEQKF